MTNLQIAKLLDARKVARHIYHDNEIVEKSGHMYVACPAHFDVLGKEDIHPSARVSPAGCYCWSCRTFTSTIQMIRRKRPDIQDPYGFAAKICGIDPGAVRSSGEDNVFCADEFSLCNAGYAGKMPETKSELLSIVSSMRRILDKVEAQYCSYTADGIDEIMDLLGPEYDCKKILELKEEINKRRSFLDRLAR